MRAVRASSGWVRRPGERPSELLDAAIGVFSARGYRATRLEEVAEVAGVTKGTIYYYFETKEELLTQALEARIGAVFAGIEAESRKAAPGSAAERLRATLQAAWQRWRRPETARMQRLITGELRVEFPELYDKAMRAGPLQLWRLVAAVVADGQARGEFAATVDAEAAARFIVSGLMQQGLFHADLHERGLDTMEADRIFDGALDVILRGLGADRAAELDPGIAPASAGAEARRRRD